MWLILWYGEELPASARYWGTCIPLPYVYAHKEICRVYLASLRHATFQANEYNYSMRRCLSYSSPCFSYHHAPQAISLLQDSGYTQPAPLRVLPCETNPQRQISHLRSDLNLQYIDAVKKKIVLEILKLYASHAQNSNLKIRLRHLQLYARTLSMQSSFRLQYRQ